MCDPPSLLASRMSRAKLLLVRSMPPLGVSDRAPWDPVPPAAGNALQAQAQLRAGRRRGAKQRGVESVARRGLQVQPLAGDAETVPEQHGVGPGAAHARAEARIVVAAPAHGAGQRQNVLPRL